MIDKSRYSNKTKTRKTTLSYFDPIELDTALYNNKTRVPEQLETFIRGTLLLLFITYYRRINQTVEVHVNERELKDK